MAAGGGGRFTTAVGGGGLFTIGGGDAGRLTTGGGGPTPTITCLGYIFSPWPYYDPFWGYGRSLSLRACFGLTNGRPATMMMRSVTTTMMGSRSLTATSMASPITLQPAWRGPGQPREIALQRMLQRRRQRPRPECAPVRRETSRDSRGGNPCSLQCTSTPISQPHISEFLPPRSWSSVSKSRYSERASYARQALEQRRCLIFPVNLSRHNAHRVTFARLMVAPTGVFRSLLVGSCSRPRLLMGTVCRRRKHLSLSFRSSADLSRSASASSGEW